MREGGLFLSFIRRFKNRKSRNKPELDEEKKLSGETTDESAACTLKKTSNLVSEVLLSDEPHSAPDRSRMTDEYAEWLKTQDEWKNSKDEINCNESAESVQTKFSEEQSDKYTADGNAMDKDTKAIIRMNMSDENN